MERQYFDNTLLGQFYVTKMPLTVYVDGNLLKIVDADDITDAYIGNGMLPSGQMQPFDYRDIEFIMIGKNKFTIEDVNKAFAAKDQPAGDSKAKEPKDDESEEDKEPKESIRKGKNMAKSLTEKLGIGQVSEPYTIQTGDMVHNVNPQCSHFGSKGIANGVFDEDGMTMIRYIVTNQGSSFKPGDVLTKSMDQMNVMTYEPEDDGTEFDMDSMEDDDEFMGFGDEEGMFDEEAWEEDSWEEEEDDEFEEEEDDDDDAYDDF